MMRPLPVVSAGALAPSTFLRLLLSLLMLAMFVVAGRRWPRKHQPGHANARPATAGGGRPAIQQRQHGHAGGAVDDGRWPELPGDGRHAKYRYYNMDEELIS